MRVAVRLGLLAGSAAALVGALLPGPAANAATTPWVLTRADDRSVYLSDGTTSTPVALGLYDISLYGASQDGATTLWNLGTAFRQVLVVHGGAVVHVFDDVARDVLAGAVSGDGRTVVVALGDPSRPGMTSLLRYDVGTGALDHADVSGHVEDVGVRADGTWFYALLAGSPATALVCHGTSACTSMRLTGVDVPWGATAYVRWSRLSPDSRHLAMDVVTDADQAPHDEGWLASNDAALLPDQPVSIRDTGALPAGTVGGFLGTGFDLAEPGQLLTYDVPDNWGGTQFTTTPMTMNGDPFDILDPGAKPATSFAVPPPIPTFSQVWLAKGSYPVATSTTVYLNTAIALVPAVQSDAAPWDDLRGYWDPRTSYLLYSVDRGLEWPSYPWSTADFVVTRNVWVRATHQQDDNSQSSFSAVVQYTAKPYLVVHYTASTRHLYGTANVATGNIVQVQRRSSTGTWTAYYTRVRVTSYAWGVTLPAVHATWRVVVPATATYIATVSAAVTT